jgi:hypothetical protein
MFSTFCSSLAGSAGSKVSAPSFTCPEIGAPESPRRAVAQLPDVALSSTQSPGAPAGRSGGTGAG